MYKRGEIVPLPNLDVRRSALSDTVALILPRRR